EQIAGLRTVPGLDVVRPADAAEVVAVWRRMATTPGGPTALILSRQDVPVLERRSSGDSGSDGASDGTGDSHLDLDLDLAVANGGYVVWQHAAGDDLAIIATGSEVALAIEAAQVLAAEGAAVRVISVPCV